MKIATYNINSVRLRINSLISWIKKNDPDIVMLQEIKCQNSQFPEMELNSIGYNCEILGQKAYNGVAILSKHKIENVSFGFGNEKLDTQARFIDAKIKNFNVCCLYLPNGNPVSNKEKFNFKIEWMEALYLHLKEKIKNRFNPLIVGGDFNVIPNELDCVNITDWENDASRNVQTIKKWNSILNLGLYDSFRILNPEKQEFSFWDYQKACWQRNDGIRIDFILTNAIATDMIKSYKIDKETRNLEKPSDHCPVILELDKSISFK